MHIFQVHRTRRNGVGRTRDTRAYALHVVGDFVSRICTLLGQRAYFLRDHRETATGAARARRFDGRVEREQVGLGGDFRNHLYKIIDNGRRVFERGHFSGGVHHRFTRAQQRVEGALHLLTRGVGGAADVASGTVGFLGGFTDRCSGFGEFVYGIAGCVQRVQLQAGTVRNIHHRCRDVL